MLELTEKIFSEFGFKLELKPFGDNSARDNVFLGKNGNENFIVKVEDIKALEQVKLSIKIAESLCSSENLCSSRFVKTLNGASFIKHEDEIVSVQVKEELTKVPSETKEDLTNLGKALGEFHKVLLNLELDNLPQSDFYKDFMGNYIRLAQNPERLDEINDFYTKHSPDYEKLTQGVVHNDLNSNNLFLVDGKYFFIDFELLKYSPLISDLGVLILGIWNSEKGVADYFEKLNLLLEGYLSEIKLMDYDKKNIVIFSLRYLYSDENWYNYWSKNGNPNAKDLIPKIVEKQSLLLKLI